MTLKEVGYLPTFIIKMKNKECKKHKWRVGSKNGEFILGNVIPVSINIWCENCNKKIKAYLFPSFKLKKLRKMQ